MQKTLYFTTFWRPGMQESKRFKYVLETLEAEELVFYDVYNN